ncbi:MAG TPA: ATP-grasp domain-containing protein [Myxococcales bacterium]|jgi:D-alanine-D-alanine ligase
MRITLTYDTLASAIPVAAALEKLGHRVESVDAARLGSRTVAQLLGSAPELVFNLSPGREGGFASVLEELGLPHTGSSGAACGLMRLGDIAGQVAANEGVLFGDAPKGTDYLVAFVAGAIQGGVLAPLELRKDQPAVAKLDPATRYLLASAARAVVEACGCRDVALVKLRMVRKDGGVHFVSIEPVPSLDPKGALALSAAHDKVGLGGVVRAMVESAAKRHGLKSAKSAKRKAGTYRVGFAFNVKRVKPKADGSNDREAEYDSPKTLGAIRDAIASYGHEVVDLECDAEISAKLETCGVDFVFNLAEGLRGRNRESVVPALCEHLDLEYTGSDAATLSMALDKDLAKKIVRAAGVLAPASMLMTTGKESLAGLKFPLIVKPVAEGSSKGVLPKSVAEDERTLRRLGKEMADRYGQPALVEEYIKGREFTVGLLGEGRGFVMPPMEVVFTDKKDKLPVYSFEHKLDWNRYIRYEAPAKVPPAVSKAMMKTAQDAFQALGCRDVARIDFRMSEDGGLYFIEANPLPGLTPGWSDLVLSAKGIKMDYRTLIGEIMKPAIRRLNERMKAAGGRRIA